MSELTIAERELFAKYWGQEDLAHNEDFWADIRVRYMGSDKVITLPVSYNPLTVRRVLDMLKCPPGVCGLCCRYKTIHITSDDILTIIENTGYTQEDMDGLLKEDDKGKYLEGLPDGCPFLMDNACAIWEHRPSVCYLYPIQGGRTAFLGEEQISQMIIKLKCPASIGIVEKVMQRAVTENPNMMLLPDLSLVNKYKEEVAE